MNKSIFLPHFMVQRSMPDTEAEAFLSFVSPEKERHHFFHCCLRHLPTPWCFSFINIKGGTLSSPDATQPSAQHLHETSCSPGEFPQHLMLFCNTQKWVKKRGCGGSWCGSSPPFTQIYGGVMGESHPKEHTPTSKPKIPPVWCQGDP